MPGRCINWSTQLTSITSRLYQGQEDLDRLAGFAREMAALRNPRTTYLRPGDVAWQLYNATSPAWFKYIRLWFADESLVAWAIFEPPLTGEFDVHDGFASAALFDEVTGWLVEKRTEQMAHGGESVPVAFSMLEQVSLSLTSLESDHARNAYFEAHGWKRTDARHNVKYRRSLDSLIEPANLPPGYHVRNVTEADVDARAELHRDAWSVWGPSSFSANRYRRLRAQPEYDDRFDIVTVSPGGDLLSYCLGWVDRASGAGHFEPVGTRPSEAGKGYGKAAILEALRRMKDEGLHTAYIGTASVNERALRLYPACGFEFVEKEVYWFRSVR